MSKDREKIARGVELSLYRASADFQWAKFIAEDIEFPPDTARWLDELEAQLMGAPKIVREEFAPVLRQRIRQARNALSKGDTDALKMPLFVLYQNADRLRHDISTANSTDGAIRGGQKSKRNIFAQQLAEYLVERDWSNCKEAFYSISNNILQIDEDTGVYREGDNLIFVDMVIEGEPEKGRPVAYRTFRDSYFSEARSN